MQFEQKPKDHLSSRPYSKLVALKRHNGISLAVKALACRNAGFNCDAVIRGNTEEEIMASTMEHAVKAHNMKPEDVADEEFEEHVRGLITTAC
jgi:predicted small metal-binding protein